MGEVGECDEGGGGYGEGGEGEGGEGEAVRVEDNNGEAGEDE